MEELLPPVLAALASDNERTECLRSCLRSLNNISMETLWLILVDFNSSTHKFSALNLLQHVVSKDETDKTSTVLSLFTTDEYRLQAVPKLLNGTSTVSSKELVEILRTIENEEHRVSVLKYALDHVKIIEPCYAVQIITMFADSIGALCKIQTKIASLNPKDIKNLLTSFPTGMREQALSFVKDKIIDVGESDVEAICNLLATEAEKEAWRCFFDRLNTPKNVTELLQGLSGVDEGYKLYVLRLAIKSGLDVGTLDPNVLCESFKSDKVLHEFCSEVGMSIRSGRGNKS